MGSEVNSCKKLKLLTIFRLFLRLSYVLKTGELPPCHQHPSVTFWGSAALSAPKINPFPRGAAPQTPAVLGRHGEVVSLRPGGAG